MPPPEVSPPKTEIFFSLRTDEAKAASDAIKSALEDRLPGIALVSAAADAGALRPLIERAKVAVIMGSPGYGASDDGAQTTSGHSTHDELQAIWSAKTPFCLVKMTERFDAPLAEKRLGSHLDPESFLRWPAEPSDEAVGRLADEISDAVPVAHRAQLPLELPTPTKTPTPTPRHDPDPDRTHDPDTPSPTPTPTTTLC